VQEREKKKSEKKKEKKKKRKKIFYHDMQCPLIVSLSCPVRMRVGAD
jgi:hypothetical protein